MIFHTLRVIFVAHSHTHRDIEKGAKFEKHRSHTYARQVRCLKRLLDVLCFWCKWRFPVAACVHVCKERTSLDRSAWDSITSNRCQYTLTKLPCSVTASDSVRRNNLLFSPSTFTTTRRTFASSCPLHNFFLYSRACISVHMFSHSLASGNLCNPLPPADWWNENSFHCVVLFFHILSIHPRCIA